MRSYHLLNYAIGDFVADSSFWTILFFLLFAGLIWVSIALSARRRTSLGRGLAGGLTFLGFAVFIHGVWYWKNALVYDDFTIINTTIYRLDYTIAWTATPTETGSRDYKKWSIIYPGETISVSLPTRRYDRDPKPSVHFRSNDEELMLWVNSFAESTAGCGIAEHPDGNTSQFYKNWGSTELLSLASSDVEWIDDGDESGFFVIVDVRSPLRLLDRARMETLADARSKARLAEAVSESAQRQMDFHGSWDGRHFPVNLGVKISNGSSNFELGAQVTEVFAALPPSGEDSNPLIKGDLITAINGEDVFSRADVLIELLSHSESKYAGIEETVTLQIVRGGANYNIETTYWFNKSFFEEAGHQTSELQAVFLGAYDKILMGRAPAVNATLKTLGVVAGNGFRLGLSKITGEDAEYDRVPDWDEEKWNGVQGSAMYQQWHGGAYELGAIVEEVYRFRKRAMRKIAGENKTGKFVVNLVDGLEEWIGEPDPYTAMQFEITMRNGRGEDLRGLEGDCSLPLIWLDLRPSKFRQVVVRNNSDSDVEVTIFSRGTDYRFRATKTTVKAGHTATVTDAEGNQTNHSGDVAYWWAREVGGNGYWSGEFDCYVDGERFEAHDANPKEGFFDIRLAN